jgi:hypothetical protein
VDDANFILITAVVIGILIGLGPLIYGFAAKQKGAALIGFGACIALSLPSLIFSVIACLLAIAYISINAKHMD